MLATEQPEIAQLPEEYILTPYSVSNSISAYILSHKLCYLKYGYYGYYVVKSNDYLYPITRNDPLYRSDDPPQGSDFGQWSDEMILFGTGLKCFFNPFFNCIQYTCFFSLWLST